MLPAAKSVRLRENWAFLSRRVLPWQPTPILIENTYTLVIFPLFYLPMVDFPQPSSILPLLYQSWEILVRKIESTIEVKRPAHAVLFELVNFGVVDSKQNTMKEMKYIRLKCVNSKQAVN